MSTSLDSSYNMLDLYRLSLILEQDLLSLPFFHVNLLVLHAYLGERTALAERLFLTIIHFDNFNNALFLSHASDLP